MKLERFFGDDEERLFGTITGGSGRFRFFVH
jgi:hypothetical protein